MRNLSIFRHLAGKKCAGKKFDEKVRKKNFATRNFDFRNFPMRFRKKSTSSKKSFLPEFFSLRNLLYSPGLKVIFGGCREA